MPLTGAAAVRLYDDHVDAVHALITRRVGAEASLGITAEAFEYALRTWDRFDQERGTERLFLFGAAVTTLRNHVAVERAHLRSLRSMTDDPTLVDDPLVAGDRRSPARVVSHAANSDLLGASADSTDEVLDDDIAAAMQAVSESTFDDRDIVLLSLWESSSQSAIAEVLDMSVGAIRSALGRVRRELKLAVGEARNGSARMNVFDTVQAARPAVDPIPLANRRMIRENLFGSGHDDTTRAIRARSESGAVVSTAPHGFRRPQQKRTRAVFSLMRTAAGLLLLITIGVVAWSLVSDDGGSETVATTTSRAPTSTVPVTEPAALPAFVRTGVSRDQPLLLPSSFLSVDSVSINPAGPGSSAVIIEAPDGTQIWMSEFDGEPAPVDAFDIRQVGAVGVAVVSDPDGASVGYRVASPCGVVLVNDAPGREPFRPEMELFFASMSIDADARIDVSLPPNWSIIDVGNSTRSYSTQFQLPVFTETKPVKLLQFPDGSISQATFGGRQLDPVTFLGGPAYVDAAPSTAGLVSVYWQDARTVFNASSDQLTFPDLESFIESLEPASEDDFSQRFDLTPLPDPVLVSGCVPQPKLGPSLNP